MPGTASRARSAPRWPWVTAVLFVLAGLGISIYLTIEHYGGNTTLACPSTSAINCLKVTTGPYSEVFGLPVAVYGVAFFAVMAVLVSPAAWRVGNPLVHRLRLAAVLAGVIGVLYLVYVELFKAEALCLWCTAVHVLTVALFVVVLAGGPPERGPAGPPSERRAAEPERLGGRS